MKLAIMQPYFFPHIGYYQLAASVDHFMFLDNVNFIKGGFINRNRMIMDGELFKFSIPVQHASQNRAINQHVYSGDFLRFLAQLRHSYSRAPMFDSVYALIESVCADPDLNVARKNARSIKDIFTYLNRKLDTSFTSTSPAANGRAQQRIIDLCVHHGASDYHNSEGGQSLYDSQAFLENQVNLRFVAANFPRYTQSATGNFIAGASIIDLLMHVPPADVNRMLDTYRFLPPKSNNWQPT